MIGFLTLFYKEFLRFWKVAFQTIAAPVLTALLYLLIFGHVLDGQLRVHGVEYTAFLIPGLVMMQVLQNAFANSSSSLIQAKITGSIVFVLLPPISYGAFFLAYVLAATLRGLLVGLGVLLATVWFADLQVVAPGWILMFALLGGALFGAAGMIAGIWAEKFDQLAAFQQAYPDISLTDEVIENDIPPRITKKLEQGKISFLDFLEECRNYLTKGKVVDKGEEPPAVTDISKNPGSSSQPSGRRARSDYEEEIF